MTSDLLGLNWPLAISFRVNFIGDFNLIFSPNLI
jgi:hypothetical protein